MLVNASPVLTSDELRHQAPFSSGGPHAIFRAVSHLGMFFPTVASVLRQCRCSDVSRFCRASAFAAWTGTSRW